MSKLREWVGGEITRRRCLLSVHMVVSLLTFCCLGVASGVLGVSLVLGGLTWRRYCSATSGSASSGMESTQLSPSRYTMREAREAEMRDFW
jgi:hypothetical protein